MSEAYDFIIVGGGTSGCVLARRLAEQSPSFKVLLIEGGGVNDDPALRSPDRRWSVAFTEQSVNWGYVSTPQKHLNGRKIACARGKGLGGSSAINFSCWLIGHREDFNEWAEQVQDPCWKWDGDGGVRNRFRKIENFHDELDDVQATIVDKEAQSNHATRGTVDLTFDTKWTHLETTTFAAVKEFGMTINGDLNSGDPTGWGIAPATYYKGLRVTSSSAYLNSPPANLTIKVNSPVSRIIFDESKRAVAVEILTGEVFRATKDIILSAGSLDTPKILLLSGIGPADDLISLSIPLIQDLPVGKNLKDHCFITSTLLLKPQTEIPTIPAPAPSNPITSREALITGQAPMGWLSSPTVQSSAEFQALDENTKNHLLKIPTFELMTPGVAMAQSLPPLELGDKVISFLAAVMNAQSVGSVRLASTDPTVPALIDLNYLSHPYDKRVAIEALRCLTEFSEAPAFEKVTARRIEGPSKDADDETLWEHCKKAVAPVWHFAGTCKMGRDGDEAAVVDKEFRVKGVKGLRVVDLSVLPVLPNNHTQSTAYLVGETGAEKLIAEYGL